MALVSVVAAASPPAGAVESGSVSGLVRLAGPSSRRLATAGAYPGRRVTIPGRQEASELANVVVYIRRPQPAASPAMRVAIRQVNEEFVPHVVAVTTGSTVEFPNEDLVFHNVFSLSRAATFDLGRYPRHASKARVFSKPGIVKVFCHLHSHMNAVVRVFDHPYFTTPTSDGRFTIAGLEPGRHRLVAWHETGGEAELSLVVAGGETTEATFELPLAD